MGWNEIPKCTRTVTPLSRLCGVEAIVSTGFGCSQSNGVADELQRNARVDPRPTANHRERIKKHTHTQDDRFVDLECNFLSDHRHNPRRGASWYRVVNGSSSSPSPIGKWILLDRQFDPPVLPSPLYDAFVLAGYILRIYVIRLIRVL